MAASHILFGALALVVILIALVVASRIPAFAQDERDHRDLGLVEGRPVIVRPPAVQHHNDNLGPVTFTERTMMGFVAALVLVIATFAVLTFGGVA